MDISKQNTSPISPTVDDLLSRLSIDSTGTVLVYVVSERWVFTSPMEDLHDIHLAEVEVGAHPYAEVTLAFHESTLVYQPLLDGILIERTRMVASDWMDWVDEVMSFAQEECFDDDDPIASDIRHAMQIVGRIRDEQAALVESVRDAA